MTASLEIAVLQPNILPNTIADQYQKLPLQKYLRPTASRHTFQPKLTPYPHHQNRHISHLLQPRPLIVPILTSIHDSCLKHRTKRQCSRQNIQFLLSRTNTPSRINRPSKSSEVILRGEFVSSSRDRARVSPSIQCLSTSKLFFFHL